MSAAPNRPAGRKSRGTAAAFLVGLPLAAAVLYGLKQPGLQGTLAQRYVSHPVEAVEVVLFCAALAVFGFKFLQSWRERRALPRELLPAWDGQPVPPEQAPRLLAELGRQPAWVRNSIYGRRVQSVLEFVCQRRSARDLDDQMRALSDADLMALDSSYGLTRFICWAIPILGFLGTVLGITEAVAGVTPEVLEQSISTVTEGLALAFDTTGLALSLTMATMFLSFLIEKREQAILEEVDGLIDLHLAHRFARPEENHHPYLAALQQHTQMVLSATQTLVEMQAQVWAGALTEALERIQGVEQVAQERLATAMAEALGQTLDTHADRLLQLQAEAERGTAALLEPLTGLTQALHEQRQGLTPVAEGMREVGESLRLLQEEQGALVRLERQLSDNLNALEGSGAFEQAVHSLTAAVHLLTARQAGRRGQAA